MDLPQLVRDRLDDESVLDRVDLGGEDAVYVTPTRTLVYRAEGLLSDESVSTYPHDVERLALSVGRRKATLEFTYVDTEGKFTVPANRVDDVLDPVLGGVLRSAGVLDADERVREAHRFSELTLVVTDARVVKHVGNALWDPDFEEFPFEQVTDLTLEEGSVATQLVVEVDGRPQRVKLPSDEARAIHRTVEEAVLAYHDVATLDDLREEQGVTESEPETDESLGDDNITPLVGGEEESVSESTDDASGRGDVDRVESETTAPGVEEAPEAVPEEILDRLDALEDAVERQNELLEQQQATIEQLVDELRRGR